MNDRNARLIGCLLGVLSGIISVTLIILVIRWAAR